MRRGDIYVVDLEPTKGHEQRGKRHVFVVSPAAMNKRFIPLVCPITIGGGSARDAGFAVSLHGACKLTDGVVLCHQVRALDLEARNGRRVERAPAHIVTEVLATLQDIFADEEGT